MSENRSIAAPPPATLLQMTNGYMVSQAIYVAAKLGLADLLNDGPRAIGDLAAATQSDAPALRRVLRALASVGVFTEASPGTYALTPLAVLLRSGTPESMRSLVIFQMEKGYLAWGDILYSVQTGETAFDHLFGMSLFAHLALHPESDRLFNEAMTGVTTHRVSTVMEAYDFSPFKTIVDVGGSYGTMLVAILQSNLAAQGILFDQPHVVAAAEEHLLAAGVAERCTTVGGDFFVEVPANGDVYLLSMILHNWDDERCVAILQRCRRAIPTHGKLLVIELVLPPGEEPFRGKWTDLNMLVMLGGRERTAEEYAALFHEAGFALDRIVATPAGQSVVEAVPV